MLTQVRAYTYVRTLKDEEAVPLESRAKRRPVRAGQGQLAPVV